VTNHDALKAKGVDTIACTSVNDVFVLTHWAKDTGADGKIVMLADGAAAFAKAIGLDVDLSTPGLGIRSQRYAMVIDNGVVTSLSIEDAPGKAEKSGAEAVLAGL
jgi:peroxiredoxin